MQHGLRISRRIDYGVRAMIFLASIPAERVVPFREVARLMMIPEDFLAKIMKSLVDAELVRSTRGPHGGYTLRRPATEIDFLSVIEAVEGPIAINKCLDEDDPCERAGWCTAARVWRRGQEAMLDVYRKTTIAELVLPPDASGEIGFLPRAVKGARV
jgi:Rrf2 family protein